MIVARVDGRACDLAEAVAAAADVLRAARLPLVYGLVESTVEAQREATRLADLLGGVLDSAASAGHLGSQGAFQRLGLLTASLGEMRQRANVVVFWASDPDRLHPGFLDRYAPAREGRARIAVDVGDERGPASADERVMLPPGRDVEALLVLRAFIRGRRVEPEVAGPFGLPLDALRNLGARLAGCGHGAIVHDADPAPARRDPERPLALAALVRDAQPKARLRLVGVRRPGNAVGAESVMTWQTGFPGSISFARGYPAHSPGEFTGEAVLARGDVDAALVVGADPATSLSSQAQGHLGRIPTVRIGAPESAGADTARVFLATAPFLATAGRVYRMDGIALRQRPAATGTLPTEATVLARIASQVEARRLRSAP